MLKKAAFFLLGSIEVIQTARQKGIQARNKFQDKNTMALKFRNQLKSISISGKDP